MANFPSGTIQRLVSVGGGTSAQWGQASNELYYISDDKHLMAARFGGGQSEVELGTTYFAAGTGQRFLVAVRARDPNAPPISVVVNWTTLLKR